MTLAVGSSGGWVFAPRGSLQGRHFGLLKVKVAHTRLPSVGFRS